MYHRQLITPLLLLPSNQFCSRIRRGNLNFLSHSIIFILNLSICIMKRKYWIYEPARRNWSSLRIGIYNTSNNILPCFRTKPPLQACIQDGVPIVSRTLLKLTAVNLNVYCPLQILGYLQNTRRFTDPIAVHTSCPRITLFICLSVGSLLLSNTKSYSETLRPCSDMFYFEINGLACIRSCYMFRSKLLLKFR